MTTVTPRSLDEAYRFVNALEPGKSIALNWVLPVNAGGFKSWVSSQQESFSVNIIDRSDSCTIRIKRIKKPRHKSKK